MNYLIKKLHTFPRLLLAGFSTLILMTAVIPNSIHAQEFDIESALKQITESYSHDEMALSGTFGIKINEKWWHVQSNRVQEGYQVGKNKQYTFHKYGPHKVILQTGEPKESTWYFEFASDEVFWKVYKQEWTASTASAKSVSGDVVGLNILPMQGFDLDQKHTAISYQVMEHFWKHESVEVTYFERDRTLPTHGAEFVGLYTMKDKRIGWFTLGKNQTANDEPNLEAGQVPNLFIFTNGKGIGYFGDEKIEIRSGMSIFVAPYMKHVITNPYDEPLEGIIVLYGDNIDYVTGKSYQDYLDSYHQFLGTNQEMILTGEVKN